MRSSVTSRAAAGRPSLSHAASESIAPERLLPAFTPEGIAAHAGRFRETCLIVRDERQGHIGLCLAGDQPLGVAADRLPDGCQLLACLPPLYPEWLGDRSFGETHRVRFPYIAGEMAQGIAAPALVTAMARAGMLGFFGAAGLPVSRIEAAVEEIARELQGSDLPWGSNLIHSPHSPADEEATVDLYIRRGVRNVSASAFMALTRPVVRYAVSGLRSDAAGRVIRSHHLFAKVSRPEVAAQFLAPAPTEMLAALVRDGAVTELQARLAAALPVAEDITVEADSGGHTDNRPLAVILPAISALRDQIARRYGYHRPVRVGAAGGLGTPAAAAAAFAMGAAYVLTGSINQAAVESGLSPAGKQMLAQAGMADVAMAPAADMFEMGVKVQVLKRGTLFAMRSQWLYELYRSCDSLDALPPAARGKLEREIFRQPVEEIQRQTLAFWRARNPREAERAEREPKHMMALLFRWYLGSGSRWARQGIADRQTDFQIWCGPAMGGFNDWVRGSFLEPVEARSAAQIGLNVLEGAAQITRLHQWRSYGVPVPPFAFDFRPRPLRSKEGTV